MANKTVLVGKASTTMSSTIGGVTGAIKQHFVEKFPKGYFKSHYIDTAMMSTVMGKNNDDDDSILKSNMPKMAISPKYELSSETTFNVYPDWHKAHNYVFNDTFGNYRDVLYNDRDGYYIFSIPSRLKLSFDIKIKLPTKMAAMDLMNYIYQSFYIGSNYFVNNVQMETEVPKTFIKAMMDDMKVDPTNAGSLQDFNNYLRNFSKGTITPKKNLSNGNIGYTFVYSSNLLCKIPNPPEMDVDQKDLIVNSTSVGFTMETELWVPSNFIFQTEKILTEPDYDMSDTLSTTDMVLNYSIKTRPYQVKDDKQLLNWQGFVSDINVAVDKLPLIDLLTDELIEVIRYNNLNNIDNYSLFDFILYRDENLLVKEVDYNINWETMEFILINPYFNYTHHLGIYGNVPKLKEAYEII